MEDQETHTFEVESSKRVMFQLMNYLTHLIDEIEETPLGEPVEFPGDMKDYPNTDPELNKKAVKEMRQTRKSIYLQLNDRRN